ncbi:MAG: FAD-dependent oxidoreductase, partial [Planctomycetes bacterium]|nr:FAD-dependent oxidoreductase [Planctomycetota bacterium]
LFLPEYPEAALSEGAMDLWEMCRPMIADPDLPRKIAEDRQEDIIPCMACNLCLTRLFRDQPITCMVRPWLGHEGEESWQIRPVAQKKKVVVIGAGPGGMEAAATAAERGHDVVLFEKESRVGGQLLVSSHGPSGDEEFRRLSNYYESRCRKAGVKIRTAVAADEKAVAAEAPDAVVVATGVRWEVPPIPGIDRENVVTVKALMQGEAPAGKRVVILGGKGVGIAAAQFLLHRGGHEISIVEDQEKVGRDVNASYVWRYVKKLKEGKVRLFTSSTTKAITDAGVVVAGPDGAETVVPADTVVVATPQPETSLVAALAGRFPKVLTVGDVARVRRVHNATMDGYKAGLEV